MNHPSGSHRDVWFLSLGMALFAVLVHKTGTLFVGALAGLLLAAVVLTTRGFALASHRALFGWAPSRRFWPIGFFAASALGVLLGMWNRHSLGHALLPETLGIFTLVAASIGIAEEIVYRGFVFGRMRHLGAGPAVVAAAASHTLYKVCLFLIPPAAVDGSLHALAFWTFAGGLLFGILRERLGGLLAPILAHALFDVVVYGDAATAPWWVF